MDAKKGTAAGGCAKVVLAFGLVFVVFAIAVTVINAVFKAQPAKQIDSDAVAKVVAPPDVSTDVEKEQTADRKPSFGEIQGLADETLQFLDDGQKAIEYAAKAGDRGAVVDDVEMPAWKLMQRWHAFDLVDRYAYESCYDALSALHFFAGNLTKADSADRRRSLDYDSTRLDQLLPKCRFAVDSKGRIRSEK